MADTNDTAQPSPQSAAKGQKIDVEKLADKVYRLMLADLRLERERGAGAGRPRR